MCVVVRSVWILDVWWINFNHLLGFYPDDNWRVSSVVSWINSTMTIYWSLFSHFCVLISLILVFMVLIIIQSESEVHGNTALRFDNSVKLEGNNARV